MQPTQSSATSWTASGSIPTFWRAVAKVQVAATLASIGVPTNCLDKSSDHRFYQDAKSAPYTGADKYRQTFLNTPIYFSKYIIAKTTARIAPCSRYAFGFAQFTVSPSRLGFLTMIFKSSGFAYEKAPVSLYHCWTSSAVHFRLHEFLLAITLIPFSNWRLPNAFLLYLQNILICAFVRIVIIFFFNYI